MKKIILSITIVLFINGCSSIRTKTEGFGHSYEGTTYIANSFRCMGVIPGLFIYAPFFVIDMMLSPVMDTVFLPIDLLIDPDDERQAPKC